ncbi:MAG: 2-oxoglutarate dehydrogenase E1 component [Mariprofundaceae bacterium]|nr:2-oxoglutarate dehydrogenase E1 component [Mariprofundaceae bacterium]
MSDSLQHDALMQFMDQNADLFAENAAYIENLFTDYLAQADSVPSIWAKRFEQLLQQEVPTQAIQQHQEDSCFNLGEVEYPSRAIYLIQAYRRHGHLHARLDPLGLHQPTINPELELAYYGLSNQDLSRMFPVGDMQGTKRQSLNHILQRLKSSYCGTIGPEFMHITNSLQRNWLQQHLEQDRPAINTEKRLHIFNKVMQSSEFESFLGSRYTGQKRFSLEGCESLIVALDQINQSSAGFEMKEVVLGMAHRGRLNVLANILGKSMHDIFAEFEGNQFEECAGSGDVKYHQGFSSDIDIDGHNLHLSLAFNPSHLEIISPVVLGSVRARQCRHNDTEKKQIMAVLVHGDAAFAGQGVVAESFNLSQLEGFRTGGSIHIVVNNQIGFTTNPFDARSSSYCTDIAKMVEAPIFHVNGNDPEAVAYVCHLAVEFRQRFQKDVVIDIVCFRRHGHNENDTPTVTQPLMYDRIKDIPPLDRSYAQVLIEQGILSEDKVSHKIKEYRDNLDDIRRQHQSPTGENKSLNGQWSSYQRQEISEVITAVKATKLRSIARRIFQFPKDFNPHEKIQKVYEARLAMIETKQDIDWGCAEMLAYATLLDEGGWVRLSGQDSGRGTFFHRHASVYDRLTGQKIHTLSASKREASSRFIIVDSILSEEAVMAYEYGYSVAEPKALTIWEAQYGDFANNAQVVIDQFICSGESKWDRMSGLVLWLPHGYEGQGAEHSSARLERFLQLCAENNMQVCYPTTPAQLFHLLRRQYHSKVRKPLIIMGPKSMLRQKLSFSSLDELSKGQFEPLFQDHGVDFGRVRRVLICSGKVYYDLLAAREEQQIKDIAILRIERLYPFPDQQLQDILKNYHAASEVIWVQEEPENQGAWDQIKHILTRTLLPQHKISHIARPASAAPAVGTMKRHQQQQQDLLDRALRTRRNLHGN